jgi:hypothetical protein
MRAYILKKIIVSFLFVSVIASLPCNAFAINCDSSTVGMTHYNSVTSNMEYCNGLAWQVMGQMANGNGCHWENWGSKGQRGNGSNPSNISGVTLSAQYVNVVNNGESASNLTSAAYCKLGEYVAAVEGDGVTTGAKRDFGSILCCPVGGS